MTKVPQHENDALLVPLRRPSWLKVKLPNGEGFSQLQQIIQSHRLHTVCKSAACPNMGECWSAGTATLMILGDKCTRGCSFCAVDKAWPVGVDTSEPHRVAQAVLLMKLRHVVLTSVTRDDLDDGGAEIWAKTVRAVREKCPNITIEVLPSDFQGRQGDCQVLFDARPDVFGHNVETVPRLYSKVRPQAVYERSLQVLHWAFQAGLVVKSSLLVGLGETAEEVAQVLQDLCRQGVSIVAIGQYLRPSREHLPVHRYVTPEEFEQYRAWAVEMGFSGIASGPLVRSSYHAEQYVPNAEH